MAWRRQIAEAARYAAADLGNDHPQLRQLHADLVDLAARMTDQDTEPSEPDDPRRASD